MGNYCACSMTLVTFLFILRSEQQFSKVAQQIIRTALTRPEEKGYFIAPGVLEDCKIQTVTKPT